MVGRQWNARFSAKRVASVATGSYYVPRPVNGDTRVSTIRHSPYILSGGRTRTRFPIFFLILDINVTTMHNVACSKYILKGWTYAVWVELLRLEKMEMEDTITKPELSVSFLNLRFGKMPIDFIDPFFH
jgi:hypothetical protein